MTPTRVCLNKPLIGKLLHSHYLLRHPRIPAKYLGICLISQFLTTHSQLPLGMFMVAILLHFDLSLSKRIPISLLLILDKWIEGQFHNQFQKILTYLMPLAYWFFLDVSIIILNSDYMAINHTMWLTDIYGRANEIYRSIAYSLGRINVGQFYKKCQ